MSLAAITVARNWASATGRSQPNRSGASRSIAETTNARPRRSLANHSRSLRLLNSPEHVRALEAISVF